jgi:hypothetical protein
MCSLMSREDWLRNVNNPVSPQDTFDEVLLTIDGALRDHYAEHELNISEELIIDLDFWPDAEQMFKLQREVMRAGWEHLLIGMTDDNKVYIIIGVAFDNMSFSGYASLKEVKDELARRNVPSSPGGE